MGPLKLRFASRRYDRTLPVLNGTVGIDGVELHADEWESVPGLFSAVFRGEYYSQNLHDFLCEGIEVRVERAVPVQVGGDLQPGLRDKLAIKLSSEPVRVLASRSLIEQTIGL